MPRLSNADQRLVFAGLKALYAETDLGRLREQMVHVAARLVACDLGSYNDFVSRDGRMNFAWRFPDTDEIRHRFPAFLAYFHEHPLLPRIRSTGGAPIKFSDYVTGHQLDRLNIYNEYFKEIGVRHQMLTVFDPDNRRQRGISLNRGGRDFSERDRAVLTVLEPHLTQAYNNAAALCRLRKAVASMETLHTAQAQAFLLVDRESEVQWLSAQARTWIRDFLGSELDVDSPLPEALSSWLHQQRAERDENDRALAAPSVALRFAKPHGFLLVRYAAEDADGNASLLLTFEGAPAPIAVRLPNLTTRENEVLGWIAQGKANPEIAVILGLALRTVYKHVENIFAKLNVESRAAAMLCALDAARHPPFNGAAHHAMASSRCMTS